MAKPTIIFGGGGGGTQIIEAIMRDSSSDYRLAAILDDDPAKRDLTIRGVRVVGGRESIRSTADRLGATVLIIAMPGANSALIRELAKLGVEAGLEVLVLPAIADREAVLKNGLILLKAAEHLQIPVVVTEQSALRLQP